MQASYHAVLRGDAEDKGERALAGQSGPEPARWPDPVLRPDLVLRPDPVLRAENGAGTRDDAGLNSDERCELASLRRENRRLREDIEILKRATAVFAREARGH